MIKIKKDGFTLSEVLITLSIVGVIAALVVPGVIKDINNKAMMSLLQGTVTNINDAVQTEISVKKISSLEDTDICRNTMNFLNKLDVAKEGDAFATKYTTLRGEDHGNAAGVPYQVQLKNGVSVGLIHKYYNLDSSIVVIDLNGPKEPNIIGVDYFTLELQWKNDETQNTHLGNLGGYQKRSKLNSDDPAKLKDSCIKGESDDCYSLIELSGFNPNYLNEM